MTCIFLEIQ